MPSRLATSNPCWAARAMVRSCSLMAPISRRIRPRSAPFSFWKARALLYCSRVTLPIFWSTRPSGLPLSSDIGGMPEGCPGAGEFPPGGGGCLSPGDTFAPGPPALPPGGVLLLFDGGTEGVPLPFVGAAALRGAPGAGVTGMGRMGLMGSVAGRGWPVPGAGIRVTGMAVTGTPAGRATGADAAGRVGLAGGIFDSDGACDISQSSVGRGM